MFQDKLYLIAIRKTWERKGSRKDNKTFITNKKKSLFISIVYGDGAPQGTAHIATQAGAQSGAPVSQVPARHDDVQADIQAAQANGPALAVTNKTTNKNKMLLNNILSNMMI